MSRTMRPLLDGAGEVVARVSGWHDVQHEVEAEQALEASESLFRLAMDASAIGMYFGTLEGRITHVNPALCQMLGYTADELLSMGFLDLTHPDDLEESRAGIGELTGGDREVTRVRKRYVARGGATVWADLTAARAPLPDGTLGRIICQVVDVTAEVANFEALQRAAHEFQMLAENATDVVFRTTVDGLFEWVSPSMAGVLGWEPTVLVGTPSTAIIVAEDRELVRANRLAMLAGHSRGPLVVRFMTATGGVREMSGTTHQVMSPDGAMLVGYIVGLRDVTEEQRIRRELAHRASHDSLTGVANRDDLMSRLRRRLEAPAQLSASVGVLFCDVDNLKAVNDAHGHRAGDLVLTTVAERLLAAVRSHDVVARLGGDEFVVVVNDVADVDQLRQVAEKCRRAVSAPIEAEGHAIEVTVSVGSVLASAYEDADDVLKRADREVYRAKEAGRDRVSVEAAPSDPWSPEDPDPR
jgi:diguanylate cyclase (GGDEF)-like protein/PAS domain S-box-containing protein